MDLRQLRHFQAVLATRSFSTAARELAVTQPALTRSIRDLERSVGAPLFDRNRRGTNPTPAGLEFHRYVRRILNDCDRATQEVATLRTGGVGRVTIGAGASYVSDLLTNVIARAVLEMPALEIEVVEGLIENLLTPLADGRLDLIFTTFAAFTTRPEFVLEPLVAVTPGVVAGARHALARRRDPKISELARQDWASLDQPYTLEVLQRFFQAHDAAPPRPLRVESLDLLKALVMTGQFLALLPDRAVAHELKAGQVMRLPVDVPSGPLKGGIIYLDGRVRSAAMNRVLELLRDACVRESKTWS
jgi:DNA-binding transcriptional LysR family regulator